MPAINPMIKCSLCKEQYHVGPCVEISMKKMSDAFQMDKQQMHLIYTKLC